MRKSAPSPKASSLLLQRLYAVAVEHREGCASAARSRPLLGLACVLEIAIERALARIEIDRRDFGPAVGQRDRNVHGRGRSARAALLAGEDDTIGGADTERAGFLCSRRRASALGVRSYRRPASMQTANRLGELRQAVDRLRPRGLSGPGADYGRAPRRPPCPRARGPAPGIERKPRRSSSTRRNSAPTKISTPIRGSWPRTRGGWKPSMSICWAPPVAEVYPDGFATAVSVAGVSETPRGRAGRGISMAWRPWSPAVRPGAARHRRVRREGLAATGGDPPHGP